MVRGASRWLPWSRRGRPGRGLSDTTPARCQRSIVDVAPRSTGGFGRTVTRGCVASGPRCLPVPCPGRVTGRATPCEAAERRRRLSAARARAGPGARPPPPGGSARPGPGRGRRDGSRRCSGPGPAARRRSWWPSDWATTSGSSTSASSEASTAASMAAWRTLWKAGVKPQRFMETRASRRERRGLAAVAARRSRPSGVGVHLAPLVHPEQAAVVARPGRCPGSPGEEPITASARR